MQLPKVLLVEDDRSIAGALAQALSSCYDLDIAATGQLALYKTEINIYDIIILDLNLPDLAGIFVCQQLRDRGILAPILILSADSKVMSKIHLLDSGANDYLTKPFSLGELKARLRVLSRIGKQTIQPLRHLTVGDLSLDRRTHEVRRSNAVIKLRRKEFVLLECLMEHAGSVVTRRMLTSYAWPGLDNLWTNSVDVHIKSLRDKIDRPFGQFLIKTVHGIGYKLSLPKAELVEKARQS